MREWSRRCGAIGAVVATAASLGFAHAPMAGAVVPAGQVVLAAAGADASVQVEGAILKPAQNQFNIPTTPATPFLVPGDANCSDVSYVQASPTAGQAIAPNSAGKGLDLLKAQESNAAGQKGCIDIARSSSAPRGVGAGKDASGFEYYAFALDAVSWASPSLAAPASLTLVQLQAIYSCNITDWKDIPGAGSGPIQRYFTQVGSGTGSFFQSDLLGGQDPTTVSTASCPPAKRILQSEGVQIDAADLQKAILPYSVGAWVFQTNNHVNPTLDVRNGVRLGGIKPATGDPANPALWNAADGVYQLDTVGTLDPNGVVSEANVKLNNASPAYPAVRYLFNTIDTASPNYNEAAALVGFDNVPSGSKSALCSGGNANAILSFGLGPLDTTGAGASASSNLAGATCRKYTNT